MLRRGVSFLPAIRSLENMVRRELHSSTRFTVWQEVPDYGPRTASFCQFCTMLSMRLIPLIYPGGVYPEVYRATYPRWSIP